MAASEQRVCYQLTDDFLDELVKGEVTKKALEQIDFRDDRFRLQSLQGLHVIGQANPKARLAVIEFHLENNELTSLIELAEYKGEPMFINVQQIFASHNFISAICATPANPTRNAWPVRLEQLRELDLSFNKLTEIPDLRPMPSLTTLNLAHNEIRPPWKQLRHGRSLEVLDLRNNMLNWTKEEFGRDVRVLEKLDRLHELYLANNPFVKKLQDYALYCLKSLKKAQSRDLKVRNIDQFKVDRPMRERAERLEPLVTRKRDRAFGPGATDIKLEEEKQEEGAITSIIPNVQQLNELLHDCFANPAACIKKVNDFASNVRRIMQRRNEHHFLFEDLYMPDDDEDMRASRRDLAVDEMLQNVVLLMERQPQLVPPLLRSLAYLSGVTEGQLGRRCLRQLQDLMSAGDAFSEQVVTVVNDVLVPQLKTTTDMELRSALLGGLTDLAHGEALVDALHALIPTLARWLDAESSDEVMALLAVVSSNVKNAVELGTLRVHVTVKRELERRGSEADRTNERYIKLLTVAEHLARFDNPVQSAEPGQHTDGRSGAFFVSHNLHRDVLQQLKEMLSDRGQWSGAKVDAVAAMVGFLDALMQPNNRNGVHDMLRPGRGYVKVLCQLYQNPAMHPRVLAATFRALHSVLETPRTWYPLRYPPNQDLPFMEVQGEIVEGLQQVVPLLQYLGESGSRYGRCCLLAGEGATLVGNRWVPVAQLTSPVMHQLLEQVIRLLTYFCREAANDPRNRVAVTVAARLNEHQREKYLFECLEAPSDRVRLAVVHCLKVVPLSELENAEVAHLVAMLNEVTNISAGETEKVLGVSFELLEKVVLSSTPTGKEFRGNNAENAIQAALSILERNSARDTRAMPNEDDEKYILNRACARYLRACSALPEMHSLLRNRDVMDRYNRILRHEDRYSDPFRPTLQRPWVTLLRRDFEPRRDVYRPVFSERTYCGRAVEYVLQTLVGRGCISPVGVVAPRLVRRMADVLEGLPDPGYELLHDQVFPRGEGGADSGAAGVALAGGDAAALGLPTASEVGGVLESAGAGAGAAAGDADSAEGSVAPAGEEEEEEEDEEDAMGFGEQRLRILAHIQRALAMHGDEEGSRARELAQVEEELERHMLVWWEYDVGVPGRVGPVRKETEKEAADRMQQHHIFTSAHGLERLILFMASDAERDEQDADDPAAESVDLEALPRSQLLDEFRQLLEKLTRAETLASAGLSSDAADVDGPDADGVAEGRLGEEPARSGRWLLLQSFMMSEDDPAADAAHSAAGRSQLAADAGLMRQEHERAALVAAGLRVVFALLRRGSAETRAGALAVLRQPEVLRMLVCVACGSRSRPMWLEYNVAAKLLVVLQEVLRADPTEATAPLELLPLLHTVTMAVEAILEQVTELLMRNGRLDDSQERVALHAAKVLDLMARLLPCVRLPPDLGAQGTRQAVEFLFDRIFPQSVLRMAVRLVLYDMENAEADGRGTAPAAPAPGTAALADPSLAAHEDAQRMRDMTRMALMSALVEYLRSHATQRYQVLEMFARAEVEIGLALRPAFMQDLLGLVSQRMYQAALEPLMADKGYFEDAVAAPEHVLEQAWGDMLEGSRSKGRRLLVLTNRAFYVMKPPLLTSWVTAARFDKVDRSPPVLVERTEYLELSRLLLGFGGQRPGQRIHFSTDKSEERGSRGKHCTFVFPRLGVAEQMYSAMMTLVRAHRERAGPDADLGNVPLEADVVTAATAEAAFGGQQVLLYSLVDVVEGSSRERRLIVLTPEHFYMCREDTGAWSMPVDWDRLEREAVRAFEVQQVQGGAEGETAEQREARHAKAQREMQQAAQKRKQQREALAAQHARIIQVIREHDLQQMEEIAFGRLEVPTMTIGFDRSKDAGRLLGHTTDRKQEIRSVAEVTYSVVFADDWSRQLWVAALSSLVARDYETNVDPARDARKGRAAGAAAAGAAGGKDST